MKDKNEPIDWSKEERLKISKEIFQDNLTQLMRDIHNSCRDTFLTEEEKIDLYKLADRKTIPTFAFNELIAVGDEKAKKQMKHHLITYMIEIVQHYYCKASDQQKFSSFFPQFFKTNDV